MRYEVKYNQLGIVEFNKNNPQKKLDFIDGILLMQIYNFISEWDEIETKTFNDKVYYWITYRKILDELPTIGLKTTDAIYRRLLAIEKDHKLIEKKTVQTGYENRKTYFRITPLGLETLTLRMDIPNPTRLKPDTPTDRKPHNKNTNNKNTKDERGLTHFEFLKNEFSKEINFIKEKYSIDPEEWRFLIDHFNNKKYDQKKITVTTFENVAKNWSNNLKKDNSLQSFKSLPQMKRIV